MQRENSMNKKILYVSSMPLQYNYSANIRNLALIDGLYRNGYIVDAITCKPNKNSEWYDNSMDVSCLHKYYYRGMDIAGDKKADSSSDRKGIVNRFIKKIAKSFISASVWDARMVAVRRIHDYSISENYDIMISSSDPKSSHLLARMIYQRNKGKIGKWIQYWGDPFAIDINNTGGSYEKARDVEEKILALADKVVYVSPFTLDKQKQMFPNERDKFFFYPIPVKEKTVNTQVGYDKQRLKIGYYGAYYQKDRDINPLYEAISSTKHVLEIYGSSDVTLKNMDNIRVHGKVSVSEIEDREREADVLVCICNRSGTQIPGKAYHYAMTNKYVLILTDGDYAEEITKYFNTFNRYIICENKPDSIINALKDLPDDPKYRKPCQAFDTKTIAEDFIS